ncbi:STM4013/SEN3800 family hydrolase [Bradyrhizobium sp. HKCCYLS2038]|uniref:STM4013/SEN3800 family hydrolase n=1 Tax=unclassified Bradyrhizobium TaxID=2631580 RepID=UPI003EBC1333
MTARAPDIDAKALVGSHDILLITLDTLRYDVAVAALEAGQTPNLAGLLPGGRWEKRHAPASFTYAAHQAFFAGFLPTPARPGPHPRLFAARFAGSATTTATTCELDAPDIVTGLAGRGYHTLCIGGVGFFNKLTPLGSVLPGLFAESHWDETLGVASPQSTERQVALALSRIAALPAAQRLFLFVNVSALHQPNRLFMPGATHDTPASMAAALAYVDRHMPPLFAALTQRAPLLAIICADHGTAYGEDGFHGHRLAHPSVWDVPYAEFVCAQAGASVPAEVAP